MLGYLKAEQPDKDDKGRGERKTGWKVIPLCAVLERLGEQGWVGLTENHRSLSKAKDLKATKLGF